VTLYRRPDAVIRPNLWWFPSKAISRALSFITPLADSSRRSITSCRVLAASCPTRLRYKFRSERPSPNDISFAIFSTSSRTAVSSLSWWNQSAPYHHFNPSPVANPLVYTKEKDSSDLTLDWSTPLAGTLPSLPTLIVTPSTSRAAWLRQTRGR